MRDFKLESLAPCRAGLEWVNSCKDYKAAWGTCERGDWMLWLARRRGVDLRKLTGAKAACAKLIAHLMKDERSIKAIEVAEKFASGEATRDELDDAADAAYAAAAATDAADAAYAAAAATDAAYAAYAADAAYAAAAAAYARLDILKKAADAVRAHISFDDLNIQ